MREREKRGKVGAEKFKTQKIAHVLSLKAPWHFVLEAVRGPGKAGSGWSYIPLADLIIWYSFILQ